MANHFFLLKALAVAAVLVTAVSAERFSADVEVTHGKADIQENGNQLQLNLDGSGGSGVRSKQQFLYGRFDVQIKAVPDHSAGTVTGFFLQSPRPTNDEIHFELLGNVTGQPYRLHTSVITNGKADREQQIHLWFNPQEDFHDYSIIWNPHNILWLVDEIPVRVYNNVQQQYGIPYLSNQALRVFAGLWNVDDWEANPKGQLKIDWSKAPFVASYRRYRTDACDVSSDRDLQSCTKNRDQRWWWDFSMNHDQTEKLGWVRENYLVYDYCRDIQRFPQGLPLDCAVNNV